jgi:hypothetical protein
VVCKIVKILILQTGSMFNSVSVLPTQLLLGLCMLNGYEKLQAAKLCASNIYLSWVTHIKNICTVMM